MKRRHFLASTSLAGAILPALALAATPCPPPDVSVSGGTTVTTTCDSGQDEGPPGSAPAWFLNLPDATWSSIAVDGTLSKVLPSPIPDAHGGDRPGAITDAWTGAAVDQNRGEYIVAANGGHADYPGNEAYALALRSANPAWRRLTDPTPNDKLGDVTTQGNGRYADGRPRAMHSTFETFADGRVWFPLQNSVTSNDGGTVNGMVAFNRDLLGSASSPLPWTAANLGPWEIHAQPQPSGIWLGTVIFGVAAFDPVAHKIWALGGNSTNYTMYWSVDTTGTSLGKVTRYQSNQPFGHWGGWVAVAPELRVLVAGDHLKKVITVLDLNSPGSWKEISNVSGAGYFGQGSGGVYIAANRTIAIGHPKAIGRTIQTLRIPTKVVNGQTVYDSAGQWVWGTRNPGGPTFSMPSGGNNDSYSKWNIVQDMGNGQSAIVVLTDIHTATYVYKVPRAGI